MDHNRRQEPCRWVGLTLFLSYPYWLDAEQDPWSCLRNTIPRPLETTEDCRNCVNWEPKTDASPDADA